MRAARPLLALLAACCAVPAALAALSKDAYQAHRERIQAEYQAQAARCKPLERQAQGICLAAAKGQRQVARAQLEWQYKPSPANEEKFRLAQAEAGYAVARERCGAHKGHVREICRKDAKAAFAAARAEALSSRVAGSP